MSILSGALPAAPAPGLVVAPRPERPPVQRVAPGGAPAQAGNRTGTEAGADEGRPSIPLPPLPGPDRPTGPPPAFEANLLEAERSRLRAPEIRVVPAQPGNPVAGARPAAPFAMTAAVTGSDPPAQLDIVL